ncbi:Spy/CpxP family protein refolding chaperone [Halomonas alkaliantarctica]|uniref:Spy/CpxP family protein refolding chaperone n=1 Tax=Halomonas alkaliantarctica TaxID=232346 RepID=A0ABY8LNX8_9GAMM|nr:Spy/CpxP family protein refolding chaperone [Halomonas alkaliantarctica]WGI25312.1 Spy/CpxP family protein refolding chaperone [Halomonas alkaliantarctica]
MVKHKMIFAIGLVASLSVTSSAIFAQGMNQGAQGYGNMMGGQGGMGSGFMMGSQGGMYPYMMMGSQEGMYPGMMMGGQNGMMPCPMMGGMGPMSSMVGILNEQQMSSVREMRQEHRAAQLERMGEMMNLRDEMMQIMQTERPEPEEVKALHAQMANLHGEMMADNVRMHNQMQDLLTDEQREQMRERMPRPQGPQ